ncbi:MAG: FecR family protein [Thermoanaerobaculia bacterium]
MSEVRDTRRLAGVDTETDGDRIGRLLRWAGPRPVAPLDRARRVRIAVESDWLQAVAGRRRRRAALWAGATAALAAALALVVLLPERATREPEVQLATGPVGRTAVVQGLVWQLAEPDSIGADKRRLALDDEIRAGDTLESTQDGRLALQLAAGPSLRLDVDSRVRLLSPTVFRLERGAVYVDSGLGPESSGSVEVLTELGAVTDIGTQFEVRVLPDGLRVRVREGMVSLASGEDQHRTGAGTELSLTAAGALSRRHVPIGGAAWDWILEVAPSFELEGASLDSFLRWVARETGREIRFSDRAAERAAPGVVLHGSASGLRPDQALEAVLPTCGLTHSLADGTVLIQTG